MLKTVETASHHSPGEDREAHKIAHSANHHHRHDVVDRNR